MVSKVDLKEYLEKAENELAEIKSEEQDAKVELEQKIKALRKEHEDLFDAKLKKAQQKVDIVNEIIDEFEDEEDSETDMISEELDSDI